MLCDTINRIPPITLRANSLKTGVTQLAGALENSVARLVRTGYAPEGLSIEKPRGAVDELEPFRKGWFQVQDEAAQLVSMLLAPRPGETVLDACCGMGGKTGHMGQLMQNRGRIAAVDVSENRLLRLEAEMLRLGIDIASTHRCDLSEPLREPPVSAADRILLDAPCSGLGVLRRHPDARWKNGVSRLARYRSRQLTFLENVSVLLKPGGVMVYCVCSFEPEETREVIHAFLSDHPEFRISGPPAGFPESALPLLTGGMLETLPHRHGTDGFFAVRLRKQKKACD